MKDASEWMNLTVMMMLMIGFDAGGAAGSFQAPPTSSGNLCVALDVDLFEIAMSPPASVSEPLPLPNELPKVAELGVTSGPLKSAAFFLGAYCKDYNGSLNAGLCIYVD